jgi:phosphate transport system substrate-binding protein
LVLAITVVWTGCGESQRGITNVSVRIDGSSTVYPISEAMAEGFDDDRRARGQSIIRVPVALSGTGGGFKRFATGEIDICDASRAIKQAEAATCRESGIDYAVFSVAFDGIAIVVHPECDWVDTLTVEQLKELWRPDSGVRRWSDLDTVWPDEPIRLYGPGTDSGTFDYFTSAIVGEAGRCRSDFTPSEDDNVIVQGVTGDRYALGYFGYAYYAENRDRLKVLGVDAGEGPVSPSPETIRSGAYHPLSRPLFIYVNKASLQRAEVAEFLDYYVQHSAQVAVEVGYVAVDDAIDAQNRRALEESTRASTKERPTKTNTGAANTGEMPEEAAADAPIETEQNTSDVGNHAGE